MLDIKLPMPPAGPLDQRTAEGRAACRAVGMDDYLAKPFTREALRSVLGRWLPEVPAARAPASAAEENAGTV